MRRLPLIASFVLVFVVLGSSSAFADVRTDKYEYNYGETVQITGDGMWAGEDVTVDVNYPDGSNAQHHVVAADELGTFADSFLLADGMPGGIYTVVAGGSSSGNVFTAEFDPCVIALSSTAVQYSDKATFTGQLGPTGGGPCPGGVSGRGIDIAVDTDGDGSLADEGAFATGTTGVTGAFSIQSGNVSLSPSQVTPQGTGVFKLEARLQGTLVTSTALRVLTVTGEDTTTAYTGSTSGPTNSVLALSATVADADGGVGAGNGRFLPDVNLAGNGVVTFQLFDAANVVPVSGVIAADINSSGTTTGSPSLVLPATHATYKLRTIYAGNAYYSGSQSLTDVTVTAVYLSRGFYAPVGDDNKAKAGSGIPLKWNLWLNVFDVSTEIIDPRIAANAYRITSVAISCTTMDLQEAEVITDDSGTSGLRYDYFTGIPDASGQNIYVWKTNKAWKNTCRRLTITYDGHTPTVPLTVDFKFF